jgi:biotin carboxyl carrier protein
MTSRLASLEVPARTTVRMRVRWPEALEPTEPRTILGIGVRGPTTVPTRWAELEPTCTLVAAPAALREPTPAPRPTRAYGTSCAGLAPGPAPALAQGPAPALLGKLPALEREVFQLARRIALQADLPAAMRVLHDGLSRLTDSPDAMCVLFDAALCSAWAVPIADAPRGLDDQVQQLAARVAGSGRRAVLGHALVEPVGPAPARAVLMLRRPPTRAPYGELEIATVAAIAAALVGIVGHFVADHVARREQARRDARSPFRPEALAERRGATAAPGRLVTTARMWMRWTYPALIGMVAAVIVAAAIIQVPTYSTGVSILTVEGEPVTSPVPGTVAEVLVAPGAQVAAGDPVLRLRAPEEEAELAATEPDYRTALAAFLTAPGDDGARDAIAAIATRRQHAKAIVDGRMLRASSAGIVGDLRVRPGQRVTPEAPIMKISPGADLSVVALLPGLDRPRLQVGMTLQIELSGDRKQREEAVIDAIGAQVIGPEEARKRLGDPIGDALPVTGPVVIVRAHLTGRTSAAGGRTDELHDGMLGKAEVKVDHQSLLRVLLRGKGK